VLSPEKTRAKYGGTKSLAAYDRFAENLITMVQGGANDTELRTLRAKIHVGIGGRLHTKQRAAIHILASPTTGFAIEQFVSNLGLHRDTVDIILEFLGVVPEEVKKKMAQRRLRMDLLVVARGMTLQEGNNQTDE
jgi:hypothetical protein